MGYLLLWDLLCLLLVVMTWVSTFEFCFELVMLVLVEFDVPYNCWCYGCGLCVCICVCYCNVLRLVQILLGLFVDVV